MWQGLKDEVRDRYVFHDYGIKSWLDGYCRTGGEIFCRKGCLHCCNLVVHATLTEALCISETLTEEQEREVGSKVKLILEQFRRSPDLKTFLAHSRWGTGFCPLLSGEGTCSAYTVRPFSCRALLSTKESSFCRLDFSTLSKKEKEAYLSGLDTSVVDFPLHYAAAARDLGAEHESFVLSRMVEQFGFSICGNLPLLLHLERNHEISSTMKDGYERTVQLVEDRDAIIPSCSPSVRRNSNEIP